jgi:hypothetical protein
MLPPPFIPADATPRRSFGKLFYALALGLTFAGTASAAHWAGTHWSPKPDWEVPGSAAVVIKPSPIGTPAPGRHMSPSRTGPLHPGCVHRTSTGLQFTVLERSGNVESPGPHDTVEVKFTGWDSDGKRLAGLPPDGKARFRVDQLIPGWVEGLQLMHVGDSLGLCIPEELAYKGRPGGPQGMLNFSITLLAIDRADAHRE